LAQPHETPIEALMYDQDSFFTLGVLGQLGLLAISVSMLIITTWAVMRIRAFWFTKLVIALIGFYLFVWLSPQIYYTYYLFIFDGSPFRTSFADLQHLVRSFIW
jgi:hypothetical protein